MENKYQNNKYITGLIKKQLKDNPKKSITRLFTKLKGYKRLSGCGDSQILHLIVSTLIKLKIKIDRNKLLYAYNKSSEYKQNSKEVKQADIDQLLNLNKFVEKYHSGCQNIKDNRKTNHFSIKSSSKNIYG